jgi:crotonobetainyl-CoA:carnitine CoA-transferase CaiB-like acyl-CoA transferase
MTDQPPLNDVRVLEYTRGLAGRTAGGLLADLVGLDTVAVPSEAGVGTQVIEDLLARKVAAAPDEDGAVAL